MIKIENNIVLLNLILWIAQNNLHNISQKEYQ